MLTPLVDVIFLLLTFFMLSAHVAPYSLLAITAKQQGRTAESTPGAAERPGGLLISVSRERVLANGIGYSIAEFGAAARELGLQAHGTAVVLTKSAATVQDVVSVLEILKKAEFASVSVRMRAAPKPVD